MKKITKPQQREEAVYYSDFSGKFLSECPPVELKISFNYGSGYDGSELRFDLDDEDIKEILLLIKSKLNPDTKKALKDACKKLDNEYQNNIVSRDWDQCEHMSNNMDLIRELLYL